MRLALSNSFGLGGHFVCLAIRKFDEQQGGEADAFFYFIEAHALYLPPLRPLFAAADGEELTIVASAVTLLEVLVVPYRAGNLALANRYEGASNAKPWCARQGDRPRPAWCRGAAPRHFKRADAGRTAACRGACGGVYGLRHQRPPVALALRSADRTVG